MLVVTFLFVQWLPGDPAELYAGEEASREDIERIRGRLGLDRPVLVQLAIHVRQAVTGDLGISLRSGRPVTQEIASRMPTTLRLAAISMAVAALVALPMGTATAWSAHKPLARALDWTGLAVLAVPVYWLGLMLLLTFAVMWRLLPPAGSDSWVHLILPGLALGLHQGAATARILKASLSDVLSKPYLTAAYGRGASRRRALWIHALPNALIPVVTYFGMESGRLLGGAVLTETIFAVNGLGRFLVQSIGFRDYPAIVGVVLVMAASVSAANLAADLLCTLLDPRAREAGQSS